jgi:hypothetical protein
MRDSPRRLPKSPEPLSLDLLRPRTLQRQRHVPERSAESGELGRSPAGPVRWERLQPTDISGPPNELLYRAAELP